MGEIPSDDRLKIGDAVQVIHNRSVCGEPGSGVIVEEGEWSYAGRLIDPDAVRVRMDWPGLEAGSKTLWFRRSHLALEQPIERTHQEPRDE